MFGDEPTRRAHIDGPEDRLHDDVRHAGIDGGVVESQLQRFAGDDLLNSPLLLLLPQRRDDVAGAALLGEPDQRHAAVLESRRKQPFFDAVHHCGDHAEIGGLAFGRIDRGIAVFRRHND